MQQAVVHGSFPWNFLLLGGISACKQPAMELEGTAAISVIRDTGAGPKPSCQDIINIMNS